MDNCPDYDISGAANPIKTPWSLGPNITVVVLDKKLVDALRINEENTLLEQILVDNGILLRIRRMR